MICRHWFFNHRFKFQDYNGFYDHLTILNVNISSVAINTIKNVNNTIKNVNYYCINHYISKSEAINLLESSVIKDHGYLWKMSWF